MDRMDGRTDWSINITHPRRLKKSMLFVYLRLTDKAGGIFNPGRAASATNSCPFLRFRGGPEKEGGLGRGGKY